MQKRRRFKQTTSLGHRLAEQAMRLRQEAKASSAGVERVKLIRKARQIEAASEINQWLSLGLVPPT